MFFSRLSKLSAMTLFTTTLLITSLAQAGSGSLYNSGMSWTDDNNQVVTLDQWRGKLVIVSMAYSNCRRTCSLTLKKLEELQSELDTKQLNAEIVIISYDPKNDTPETWAQYRRKHNLARANWHFLTGNERDTRRISHLMGLADYWSYEDHVMHDFKIAILGPDGDIVRQIAWEDIKIKNVF